MNVTNSEDLPQPQHVLAVTPSSGSQISPQSSAPPTKPPKSQHHTESYGMIYVLDTEYLDELVVARIE